MKATNTFQKKEAWVDENPRMPCYEEEYIFWHRTESRGGSTWNEGRLLLKADFTQSRQLVVLVPAQGCKVHISHQPCPGLGEEARRQGSYGYICEMLS